MKGPLTTAGMTDDQLYLIDTQKGRQLRSLIFGTLPKVDGRTDAMTKDGKALFISMTWPEGGD